MPICINQDKALVQPTMFRAIFLWWRRHYFILQTKVGTSYERTVDDYKSFEDMASIVEIQFSGFFEFPEVSRCQWEIFRRRLHRCFRSSTNGWSATNEQFTTRLLGWSSNSSNFHRIHVVQSELCIVLGWKTDFRESCYWGSSSNDVIYLSGYL